MVMRPQKFRFSMCGSHPSSSPLSIFTFWELCMVSHKGFTRILMFEHNFLPFLCIIDNTHCGFYVFDTFGSLDDFVLTLGPCWIHVSSSICDLIICFVIVSHFLHHFMFSTLFSYHSLIVFRLGLSFWSKSMEH